MATDAARGVTVLFGGYHGSGPGVLADTWEFDGRDWVQRHSVTQPPARAVHAMVFDHTTDRVLLFGGLDAHGVELADTWAWDGNDWTQLHPVTSPPARRFPALAYHHGTSEVVLFGGLAHPQGAVVVLEDTWTWNGATWTNRSPTSAPAGPHYALASDRRRDRVVAFGGWPRTETWEWDGCDWAHRSSTGPPSRNLHAMTFDEGSARTILHGGRTGATHSSDLGDTWTWDGRSWTETIHQAPPAPRHYHAMSFDLRSNRVLLFGGLNQPRTAFGDTWLAWFQASFTSIGAGCTGSRGAPVLDASSPPRMGGAFHLLVSHLPPEALVWLVLGASNTTWGAVNLPLNLGPHGMPHCWWHVSLDLVFLLQADVSGTIAWPSASTILPADPALCGEGFFTQAFVHDASANPAGVVVTNAGRVVIGT